MVRPADRGFGRRPACCGRRRAAAGAAGEVAVAGVGLGAQLAHEVVEEGELLAHEDAVDRVLAGDLGQQAAQLGGALEGDGAVRRGQQLGQRLDGHRVGRDAQRGAGGGEDGGARALQGGAAAHLGLDVGQARHDLLDLAGADRLALAQDGAQQPARRGDLGVEVADDVVAEAGRVDERGAHEPTLPRPKSSPRPPPLSTALGERVGEQRGVLVAGVAGGLEHLLGELLHEHLLEALGGGVLLARAAGGRWRPWPREC